MKKDKYKILQNIRIVASMKRRRKKKLLRKRNKNKACKLYVSKIELRQLKADYVRRFLPCNLKYLVTSEESPFFLPQIKRSKLFSEGSILIPKNFSIIDEPAKSYIVLQKIIYALLIEDIERLVLDYKNCECTELSTQVLLDIILSDYVKFKKICTNFNKSNKILFPEFCGININNKEVKEMMWSVGSPATLKIGTRTYNNVIKYPLRTHSIEKYDDEKRRMEQKELDTTELIDYVIDCLSKMNKKLTSKKRDDLCTVIGEILINAEEHSTTNRRFSIGFFREHENQNSGVFRLVILNFGQTIYQKFKSEDCPNKEIVCKMSELSKRYTQKKFFLLDDFEEENLWTLYALQEGITSISTESYKRGNGSIRFIESFFNIKGNLKEDDISRMTLLSGNTKIIFDGTYSIIERYNNGEKFSVMTFNKSGNIEEKPDSKYVSKSKFFFPGTMFSVKLLLNNDDIQEII